ncbi:hypothetical protein YC2023_026457 [Brassica napus]
MQSRRNKLPIKLKDQRERKSCYCCSSSSSSSSSYISSCPDAPHASVLNTIDTDLKSNL